MIAPLPTPCYIVSDAHLGAVPDTVERTLLGFLHGRLGERGALVINGDLFDFWFEWRHVMPRRSFRVLAAIAQLRESGWPVVWTAGNHDAWGGEILARDVGVTWAPAGWRGGIGPWRAWIHHGDGLRGEVDRTYRRWQRVLRHPWAIGAYRLLHPDVGSWLALQTSKTSRAHGAHDEGAGLRDAALARMAAEASLDLVVFGHAHARTLVRAPGGGVYANPGAWLDAPVAVRVDDDRVSLVRFDATGQPVASGEGDGLDVLDRRDAAQEALREP